VVDFLHDPDQTNSERYYNYVPNETVWKWGEKEGDEEQASKDVLADHEQHKTEIWIFPAGYISRLELDFPCFMTKTISLLQGDVSP
jgi:hypothetical protein